MNLDTADVQEELQTEVETEAETVAAPEVEATETVEADDSPAVVSLDEQGDSPPQAEEAPQWVKDVRKKSKEDAKRIRELEQKLKELETPVDAPKLGEKPRLSDPDIDFDEDAYDAALAKWQAQKELIAKAEAEKHRELEAKQAAMKAKQERYIQSRAELEIPDYEELEDEVKSILNPVQQALIVEGCKKPAEFVATLAKSPKTLKELAAIVDPAEFAFEAGKLYGKLEAMKTQPKAKPAPETRVRAATTGAAVDGKLDKLREEAEKTGDYSKLLAHKKQMRAGK